MASSQQLRGRMGGLTTASRHQPSEYTRAATAAFHARFERMADPEGVLPPDERARRAKALFRLHMTRLAYARHKKS